MADINPRVDIVFKKICGVDENKDLLISLINAVVGLISRVVYGCPVSIASSINAVLSAIQRHVPAFPGVV